MSADAIPKSDAINLNAKSVAESGWRLAKTPLKEFMKKDGGKFLKAFLKTAVNPFNLPKVKNGVPKILLTRDDYYYALSYLKYLESKQWTQEALET